VAWWEFALLGASGGATVEILAIYSWIRVWRAARSTPTGRRKRHPPRLREVIDWPPHTWLLAVRALLGASAAALFGATGQICGAYMAVALGFAAPSVLTQLGTIPQVKALFTGSTGAPPTPEDGDGNSPTLRTDV
jgi:membrane protein required for beta-lactamase induction